MQIKQLARIGAAILIATLCFGALIASWRIEIIRMGGPIQTEVQNVSDLIADILPPPEYVIEAYLEATLLANNPSEYQEHASRLAQLRKDYDARQDYWHSIDLDPTLRDGLFQGSHPTAVRFWTEIETMLLPAAQAGDTAALQASYARVAQAYADHRAKINILVENANNQQAALRTSAANALLFGVSLLIALAILVIGLVFAFSIYMVRHIVAPLGQVVETTMALADGHDRAVPHLGRPDELGDIARAVDHFRRSAAERVMADMTAATDQKRVTEALADVLTTMATGDLTKQIMIDLPEDYSAVGENLNATVATLRDMIQSVVETATGIEFASNEIASASFDLARRTESNAASLEETSAALVQIDDRLKATTLTSRDSVGRADRAISTVNGGRQAAGGAVLAMEKVSESARGIDNVIEGLDKIAFQTRVLAMNAAVEAGRAGDAGRGFAVVADLVSALAMRAEEEAKGARDQLTVTQAEIGNAVGAVKQVDSALVAIASDVSDVHALLGTIASDNQVQSLAVTEINAAVRSMDLSTQQNAAMVEQTSASARVLSNEVAQLSQRAAAFKFERRVMQLPVASDRRAGTGPLPVPVPRIQHLQQVAGHA